MDKETSESIEAKLKSFENQDFVNVVSQTMLALSDEEKLTVEFVYWFCHLIERDLTQILEEGMRTTNKILGQTPEELEKYIRETFKIKLEKVDPAHPSYNPNDITFGDKIYVVERMRGETPHTNFLWKIKKIRDDVSHGRIGNLRYNNQSLTLKETKAMLVKDYIEYSAGVDTEEVGGFMATMNDEDKQRVENIFNDWQANQNNAHL